MNQLENIVLEVSKEIQSVSIIIQQDTTIYSLFISSNCSTCFEWYLHPSSGAHIAVSTVFVIIQTVTATCRELMSTTSNSKRSKNSRMFKHREKTNDWIYYDTVYYDAVKVNKRKYVLLAYPGTISTLCFYIQDIWATFLLLSSRDKLSLCLQILVILRLVPNVGIEHETFRLLGQLGVRQPLEYSVY